MLIFSILTKKYPIPKRKAEDYTSLYTTDAQIEWKWIFYSGCWYEKGDTFFFYIFRNSLSKNFFRKPWHGGLISPCEGLLEPPVRFSTASLLLPKLTILCAAKKRCVWKTAIFESFRKFLTFLNTWTEKRIKFPF